MTRENPLMEVQGIRSFEIPGTGSNAFLWKQTATSRPMAIKLGTAVFAKNIKFIGLFEINMKQKGIIKIHLCCDLCCGGETWHRQL